MRSRYNLVVDMQCVVESQNLTNHRVGSVSSFLAAISLVYLRLRLADCVLAPVLLISISRCEIVIVGQ